MAIYQAANRRSLSSVTSAQRLTNQVVFSGASGNVFAIDRGDFFLEVLQLTSGTAIILDGDGNTIATGVKDFEQDRSPLRCPKGITITGTVAFAKGYYVVDTYI